MTGYKTDRHRTENGANSVAGRSRTSSFPIRSSYTTSKKVSGLFGSNTSLQVMTVTRSSVSDRLMMLCVQPGIISYDFGETFCISDYEMRLLPHSVSHFLSLFQRRISLCDFNYPSLAKEFNIDPEYQKREILDVARRVMQITEDDISQLETELNTIFQPVIAQYYVGCIRILQNRISKL